MVTMAIGVLGALFSINTIVDSQNIVPVVSD